ncbi:MAG: hypothetical protein QNJ32_01685 [Xenococcaceae cyanobacterium MO_167.B27]|nr:hypothetical protein [Xenococcaceae cyanobacterium MO_167.B27]
MDWDTKLSYKTLLIPTSVGENAEFPDYFTFTVPEGLVLKEIALNSWTASPTFEDIAFFAVQEGTQFDFVFPNENQENPADTLLGWSHLRNTQVGDSDKILLEMSRSNTNSLDNGIDDIYQAEADNNPYSEIEELTPEEQETLTQNLRNLSSRWASGADGFSLPLESGDYYFWLRQGSPILIEVDLDFKTASTSVTEPVGTPKPFSIFSLATTVGLGILITKQRSK